MTLIKTPWVIKNIEINKCFKNRKVKTIKCPSSMNVVDNDSTHPAYDARLAVYQ